MKIPFETTIATSYRFAFRNILSILGIGWAPALAMFAITAGLIMLMLPGIRDLIAQGEKVDAKQVIALLPMWGAVLFVWIVLFLVTVAMIYAGVIRKALGLLSGPVYFYFPLDSQVWRIVGAFLIVWALFWGAAMLLAVVLVGVGILVGNSGPAFGVLAGILAALAMVAGYYALIRVQFFLPVIVVAENHISLHRAWALGRSNFWRILGITLIMTIPLAIASSTITNSFASMYAKPILPGMTPVEVLSNSFHGLAVIAPLYIFVQFVYVIFVLAFTAIAGTAAYRFVTGGESIAPPPPAKA